MPLAPLISFVLATHNRGPILIDCLQRTLSCGKLAKYLVAKGHHPLLAAADLQRPAAVEQLRVIGEQVGVPVYTDDSKIAPHGQVTKGAAVAVCRAAINQAKSSGKDVVILDTAGRLH